jgi:hypothetical protein
MLATESLNNLSSLTDLKIAQEKAAAWAAQQQDGDSRQYAGAAQPDFNLQDHSPACERKPTLREESEKAIGYHRSQADRADKALAFFRANPAFDEFIRLIRSGIIKI